MVDSLATATILHLRRDYLLLFARGQRGDLRKNDLVHAVAALLRREAKRPDLDGVDLARAFVARLSRMRVPSWQVPRIDVIAKRLARYERIGSPQHAYLLSVAADIAAGVTTTSVAGNATPRANSRAGDDQSTHEAGFSSETSISTDDRAGLESGLMTSPASHKKWDD